MPGKHHAEARYRELRALAHRKAASLLPSDPHVRIRDIDCGALEAFAATWAGHPARAVAWPWPEIAQRFRRNYPERFEAAIWSGEWLCGLAIGRPNNAGDMVALHFLEGCPDVGHPLKGSVHQAALEALFAYALAISATRIRINDPLPGAVRLYVALGFRLEIPKSGGSYCEKEI